MSPPGFTQTFQVAAAMIAFCGCLAGCASPLADRAQRADGLIDFLAENPGEVNVPVETAAGGNGRLEAVHIRVHGKDAFVSGYVSRRSTGDPRPSAHVDVFVTDARGRIVETQIADYLPRSIPHGLRGGFAHSRFTVRLNAPPALGAKVKVIFHDQRKSSCALNPILAVPEPEPRARS